MAIRAGIVERNKTTFVLGMDIGSMLDEHLNHSHTIVTSGQVEGCGLVRREKDLILMKQ